MFHNRSQFGNRASAIVGAIVMSATCMAIAVSPARAGSRDDRAALQHSIDDQSTATQNRTAD